MNRNDQLNTVIAAAGKAADGDNATAISLLVGALVLLCAKSNDPVAVLQIAINSVTDARDLATRVVGGGMAS